MKNLIMSFTAPRRGSTSFPLFPRLPVELRLQVVSLSPDSITCSKSNFFQWQFAFLAGYHEYLYPIYQPHPNTQNLLFDRDHSVGPPLPLPLRICRESREETLRHYLLAMPAPHDFPVHFISLPLRPVCINLTSDIAYTNQARLCS